MFASSWPCQFFFVRPWCLRGFVVAFLRGLHTSAVHNREPLIRNRMTRAFARNGAWTEPAWELWRSARRVVSGTVLRPHAEARRAVAGQLRGGCTARRCVARAPARSPGGPRAHIRVRHAARRHHVVFRARKAGAAAALP